MKKLTKNKFLIVYAVIIIIILVFIMFLAPDSFIKKHSRFRSFYENGELKPSDGDSEPELVPIPYEKQIENLKNKKYSYEYLIDYNNNMYKCKGHKDGEYDQGRCTNPVEIEYTTQTFADTYKDIDAKLLDVDYIFDMIKDIDYQLVNMGEFDVYTYEIPGKDSIGVSVYSDRTSITEILITRRYYAYQLKYTNVEGV